MKHLAAALSISAGLLACCSPAPPPATHGAAALGTRLSTMEDLVTWMADTAGECADVEDQEPTALRTFVGPDIAARFEPFVAEWVTCRVSPRFPKVGLLLFTGDAQREFQESWRDAMTGGEVADGPSFAFGNGFAVSAGLLGVRELGLYYFRCDYDDPRVRQVPADVDGCVFANPEHGHH